MTKEEFQYLGRNVYLRQREFPAQEPETTKSKTLTEVAMFDRFVLPTVEDIFSSLRRAAVQVHTSVDCRDYTSTSSTLTSVLKMLDHSEIDRLAKREAGIYEKLKQHLPSLPAGGRGYTHFVRGQTGYLPGIRDALQADVGYVYVFSDPESIRLSMQHPQNRAVGFGTSGRIEIGVTDDWAILDSDALGVLFRENVRASRTLSVFGKIDEELLTRLYDDIIDQEFVGNLNWLENSSEEICEKLALQAVVSYLSQRREAETLLSESIGRVSAITAGLGVSPDLSAEQEIIN